MHFCAVCFFLCINEFTWCIVYIETLMSIDAVADFYLCFLLSTYRYSKGFLSCHSCTVTKDLGIIYLCCKGNVTLRWMYAVPKILQNFNFQNCNISSVLNTPFYTRTVENLEAYSFVTFLRVCIMC